MTTFLNVANNAYSTLASGITAAATSLTVASGEGARFPSSNFHVTIDSEILKCTSRSGDVLTVTRAQEGTIAATHAAGAALRLNITAKLISDLNDEISQRTLVRAEPSANQTIPTSIVTAVNLHNEIFDALGEFNPTTYRYTASRAGYYLTLGSVRYASPVVADKSYYAIVRRNGSDSDQVAVAGTHSSNTGSAVVQCLALVFLNVNDYLELCAYHNAGSDITINLGNNYQTFLGVLRLA